MGTSAVEFKVIEAEPSPHCIVAPETVIDCEGKPIKREIKETFIDEISFDDIGGLNNVKRVLKEFIQYPIEYQDFYQKLGMAFTRGMLLYGATGCGKTMLVKALANECDMNFISIKCPELFSSSIDDVGESKRANNYMTDANVSTDRFINQLLTELDDISAKTKVFIIGETNRPDIIDHNFFRQGHLDQIVYVPLPNEQSREAILKIALRKWPLSKDVDLKYLARVLNGVSGADVIEICQRACKAVIHELIENKRKNEMLKPVPRFEYDPFIASGNDIRRYEEFARMWQPSYGYYSSIHMINDTQNIKEGGDAKQGSAIYTDDDDLYA
ncbi:unnamed protein product [Rotaria magnacalcarata]|uniref:AAA+ ATPase domain-containing protein n=1 Tax=Rotaria magnacalcarata TaxID=392030 RepID=A0A820ARX0_9BILA|nr:unnamed protein product [Rotaria magnacalcarata]